MNKTSKAIVMLLFPALALGQNSVSGTVTDKDSGQPLVGVNVVVEGTTMGAATGSDGSYTVSGVSDGSYTVTAKYIGYADQSASVTVSGSSVTANFQLESAAINMGMVDVLASRNYESLGMSGSQYSCKNSNFVLEVVECRKPYQLCQTFLLSKMVVDTMMRMFGSEDSLIIILPT